MARALTAPHQFDEGRLDFGNITARFEVVDLSTMKIPFHGDFTALGIFGH